MTEIKYAVDIDGTEHKHTTNVESQRAGWNPDVAKEYANYAAVDRYGTDIDVSNDVRVVRMGESHDQYDETGGVSL